MKSWVKFALLTWFTAGLIAPLVFMEINNSFNEEHQPLVYLEHVILYGYSSLLPLLFIWFIAIYNIYYRKKNNSVAKFKLIILSSSYILIFCFLLFGPLWFLYDTLVSLCVSYCIGFIFSTCIYRW